MATPAFSYEGPASIRVDVYIHSVPAEVTTPARPAEATPEQMLARLQRNGGNAENQQAVWDALRSYGLTPGLTEPRTGTRTGRPQPWINWRNGQDRSNPVICEVNSRSVWFTRAADVPKVRGLDGARRHGTSIRFPIETPEEVALALAAVRACL